MDCKKKELIGEYKNNGQEWTPIKTPIEVNVYDFIDKTNGKASPYGVYDIQNNGIFSLKPFTQLEFSILFLTKKKQ